MVRTICFLAGCALFLGPAPAPSKADSISLNVNCVTVSKTSNQAGSISCMDEFGFADAMASVEPSGFASVSAFASGGGPAGPDSAFALYTANFQLLVTNGVGFGLFAPCFVISLPNQGGGGMGTFGSAASDGSTVCGLSSVTPFTFGIPQDEKLTLMSGGIGLPAGVGGASAAWGGGFEVFDSEGVPLPSAVVSLVDLATVPEPNLLVPLGIVLALGWKCRRRQRV
jgi:hypothetical protein